MGGCAAGIEALFELSRGEREASAESPAAAQNSKAKKVKAVLLKHKLRAFLEDSGVNVVQLAGLIGEFLVFGLDEVEAGDYHGEIVRWHETGVLEEFLRILKQGDDE